ncbi:Stk1 family PASTA domain-containing Ser/Thr kinase [Heliobacterium mobile]|nr:Stk1 family PASTA domain-containing Ser/Thr kinase [Heliobacterium mobile]ABH04840.1 Ser/Thr protein kinase [Heliobacterium mobile]
MMGRLFGNRYEIVELLGSGGMAQVYKAWDKLLERAVTIKLLRETLTSDEEFVRRFRREAQAVAGLSHPNIVNVYDVGREGDIDYIVMEFIDGPTLKEVIRSRAPLPPEEAVELGKQISDALEHAHERGIIHRDIKPHNILLNRNGRVKVTDFGIARSVAQNTMTMDRTIVGSVHYLSPEQARGLPVDEKSDIYSLGVVMYELLSGRVPFQGETPIAVALQQIQQTPPPLTTVNQRIPQSLENVIFRAMEKEPSRRYANAQAFRKDLENVFSGKIVGRLPVKDDDSPTMRFDNVIDTSIPVLVNEEAEPVEDGKEKLKAKAKPLQKRQIGLWIGSLIALAIVLFGLTYAWQQYMSVPEATVPKVTGMRHIDAIKALQAAGLEYQINEVNHPDVAKEIVISQDPPENTKVKKTRVVVLTVSKGQKVVKVPSVVGMSQRDAVVALQQANFNVEVIEQSDDKIPPGTVISQTPGANAEQPVETVVRLAVSKGQGQDAKGTMPSLVGTKLADARAKLEPLSVDLKLKTQENSGLEAGTILAQDPAPNSPVKPGDPVLLTVSGTAAPAQTAKTTSVSFLIPNDGKDHMVKIVVQDSRGNREVYNRQHHAGETVNQEVSYTGKGTIQAYSDAVMVLNRQVE